MLGAVLLVLAGQNRPRLGADTPMYAAPDGAVLGTLNAGPVTLSGKAQGEWREATLDGWIWSASVGAATRPGFNLSVTASEGENLRVGPDSSLAARVVSGVQFNLIERRRGWVRVRRTVWIRASAIRMPADALPRTTAGKAKPAPASASAPKPESVAPAPADTFQRIAVRKGAELAVGPGGAAIGVTPEPVPGWVTARSGNWVRVRTEAWVRAEDVGPLTDSGGVTLEQLRAEPDRHVGQPVTWRVQLLSVQIADELRPEVPAGQPYVLARGPLPEAGFVYVIVTSEQSARFKQMNPLDEFTANAVIRASRTRYLPTPVIELRGQP